MQSSINSAARQEFCVRWNSHLGSIGAAFPQLLAGQRFVDVTLACEGSQIHCHRLVLAACSSYFESILAENPCKHPVIILPSEIKLWEIQALVDFMYKGEVNVTQAGLPQLLRCAEQLRIRGLYGSDAALNLNQLKALTAKTNAATAAATAITAAATNRIDSGGGGGGSGSGGVHDVIDAGAGAGAGNCVINNQEHSALDTDENTNNSTTTTNTTTTTATTSMLLQQQQQALAAQQLQLQQQQQPQLTRVKKERLGHASSTQQPNGTIAANDAAIAAAAAAAAQQQQQHQLILQQQQQLLQQQMQQEAHLAAAIMTSMQHAGGNVSNANSNAVTEDDDEESGEDSTSNQYDEYKAAKLKQQQKKQQKRQLLQQLQQQQLQQLQLQQQQLLQEQQQLQLQQQQQSHDSTIEDDHNYVAMHDEDESYTNTTMDTEHESSANASLLSAGVDSSSASYKRVRRSEASLAQAAKCVSKGQTFQTVSNMFNIPVSTIRFYMARKGILPKRKRGRGASNVNLSGGSNVGGAQALESGESAINDLSALAQAFPQIKRSDSPETTAAYHLLNYKQLNEQGALI